MTQPTTHLVGHLTTVSNDVSQLATAAAHQDWTPELADALDEIADRIVRIADIVHYHVQCDETLNPPCVVERNEMRAKVTIQFASPEEITERLQRVYEEAKKDEGKLRGYLERRRLLRRQQLPTVDVMPKVEV